MTYKEEDIVNISMVAAQLLKDGKIGPDDLAGHAGFTETIINLAEQFERENSGVDYNTGDRDYWEEIDAFAERGLIEKYGVDYVPEVQPFEIKVIIDGGITEAVLINQPLTVNVEVVSIDKDYEDYQQLKAYRDELYSDENFMPCDYSTAYFDTDNRSSKDSLTKMISAADERFQEQVKNLNNQRELGSEPDR